MESFRVILESFSTLFWTYYRKPNCFGSLLLPSSAGMYKALINIMYTTWQVPNSVKCEPFGHVVQWCPSLV